MVYFTAMLALLGIGGTLIGAGLLAGQIENLISFILTNTGTLFLFGSVVTGFIIALKNNFSDNPMWKKDLKYTGSILAVFGIILFVGPAVAGQLQGKQATATVSVSNPVLNPPEITGVEVDNFQNPSLLSQFRFTQLSFVQDDIQGDLTVSCEEMENDIKKSFSLSVREGNTGSIDLMLTGLPSDGRCIADVMIENQAGQTSQIQNSFTVQ